MPRTYPSRSPFGRSRRIDWSIYIIGGLIVGAILLALILPFASRDRVTITVNDKERVNNCSGGDCDSKYLIFTDKGVYENTDSILFLKFDSSDLYGKLQPGHTYTCDTTGFRIPLTSSYKNLLSCVDS